MGVAVHDSPLINPSVICKKKPFPRGKAFRRELNTDIAVDQSHDQSHIQEETPTHGNQQGSLHPVLIVVTSFFFIISLRITWLTCKNFYLFWFYGSISRRVDEANIGKSHPVESIECRKVRIVLSTAKCHSILGNKAEGCKCSF